MNSLPLPLTILAPFGTDEEALPYAELIATQLADDGSFTGLSILATDEDGNEVGRFAVRMRGRSTSQAL